MENRVRSLQAWGTPPDSPPVWSLPSGLQQALRPHARISPPAVTKPLPDFGPIARPKGPEECYCASSAPVENKPLQIPTPVESPVNTSLWQSPIQTENHVGNFLIDIPKPKNFVPSNMVLNQVMDQATLQAYTVLPSDNQYRGNRQSNSNKHQISNLNDQLNCALFLRNIPASCTLQRFFDSIDTGAVYSLHVMPPTGQYATCAAKLTFMNPESAAMYMQKIQQGVLFDGYRLQGVYNNREGYLRNTMTLSRVICVEGPEEMMSIDFWYRYFSQVSVFQWDRVFAGPSATPGKKRLEFRFARVNGQAQTCLQQIQQQEEFVGLVSVGYVVDPCGVSPSFWEY